MEDADADLRGGSKERSDKLVYNVLIFRSVLLHMLATLGLNILSPSHLDLEDLCCFLDLVGEGEATGAPEGLPIAAEDVARA